MAITFPRPPMWEGNADAKAYRNCDADCALCGRPINSYRSYVINTVWHDDGTLSLVPVEEWPKATAEETGVGDDPANWATDLVGSHCGKAIPRGYKMTMKRAYSLHDA